MTILKSILPVAVLLLSSAPVLAHAELISSSPAARSVVASPKTIALTFDDPLVAQFSTFTVSMSGHDMTVPVRTHVSQDRKTISGQLTRKLMAGNYVVHWTAATADGHKKTGDVPFTVR